MSDMTRVSDTYRRVNSRRNAVWHMGEEQQAKNVCYVYERQEGAEGSACVRFMRSRRKQREEQAKRGCHKYERQREEREQQAKSVCYNVAVVDV